MTSAAIGFAGVWEVQDNAGKRIGQVRVMEGRVTGLTPLLRALGNKKLAMLSLSRKRDGVLVVGVEQQKAH